MPNAFAERLSITRLLLFANRTNTATNASDDAAHDSTNEKLPTVDRTGPGPPLDIVDMITTNMTIAKTNAKNDAVAHSGQRRASLPSRANSPRSAPYAPSAAPM